MYWNILTMHGPMNVKSLNNISKRWMGFNSAFEGLNGLVRFPRKTKSGSCACDVTFHTQSTVRDSHYYVSTNFAASLRHCTALWRTSCWQCSRAADFRAASRVFAVTAVRYNLHISRDAAFRTGKIQQTSISVLSPYGLSQQGHLKQLTFKSLASCI
jgi:hypothetical protein